MNGFDFDDGGQEQVPFWAVSTDGLSVLTVFAKCCVLEQMSRLERIVPLPS